jgi:hypothetical protein
LLFHYYRAQDVGSGFVGTTAESSSFRYGFFDRIVNWIEVVLGDGEVVRASSTERSNLFFGSASWGYYSFGNPVDRGKGVRRVDLPPRLKYIRGLAEDLRS